MATLGIPAKNKTLTRDAEICEYLAQLGIEYERWDLSRVRPDAQADEVLHAYAAEIEDLKQKGGYKTADVIDVNPQTPGLDAMLARFNREHWHDEDEVRFIISGRGLFHISPPQGDVVFIEVVPGDMIRVPRGTRHWFNLCSDRQIRAIRFFQDPAGWTPHYTDSGVDEQYEPVCLGPTYIARSATHGG